MKNVDLGDRKLGPEYVTPVGIAVTACTNMAYDFSTVTLNGEQVGCLIQSRSAYLSFSARQASKPLR